MGQSPTFLESSSQPLQPFFPSKDNNAIHHQIAGIARLIMVDSLLKLIASLMHNLGAAEVNRLESTHSQPYELTAAQTAVKRKWRSFHLYR